MKRAVLVVAPILRQNYISPCGANPHDRKRSLRHGGSFPVEMSTGLSTIGR